MTDRELLELMLQKVESMDNRLDSMDNRLINMERISKIEISNNIAILAEGHSNLSRKLDEALITTMENRLLEIKINTLENEVRQLKEEFASIIGGGKL